MNTKKIRYGVIGIFAITLCTILLYNLYNNYSKNSTPSSNIVRENDTNLPTTQAATKETALKPSADNAAPKIVNILFIGEDTQEGGTGRSDSIILISLSSAAKKIAVTSIMRDMYIEIPGNGKNRINAAFAFGGTGLLDITLKHNLGVEINANISVDFKQFKTLIDKFGGVDISITKEEATYLKNNGCKNVKTGMNHMDGETALTYSRMRQVGNTDFDRTKRQRKVLLNLFSRTSTLKMEDYLDIYQNLNQYVTISMPITQLITYLGLFSECKPEDIKTYRIPIDGSYTQDKIDGMDVLVPDLKKNKVALKKILGKMK